MKVSEIFPRKYATGEDLKGQAITLTIARVAAEQMRPSSGARPETKYILYFADAKKGVILSKTLAEQIAACLGSEETDEWSGKAITLYPEPMTVAGQPRIAIRARKAVEKVAEPQKVAGAEKVPSVPPGGNNGGTKKGTGQLRLEPPARDAVAFVSRERYLSEAAGSHRLSPQAAERIAQIAGVQQPGADHAPALAYLPFFGGAKRLGLEFADARAILEETVFDLDRAKEVLEKQHTPPA